MKNCKIFLLLSGIVMITTFNPEDTFAQWGFGASFEIRNESPNSGFGLRVEREVLSIIPLINFQVRGHFSAFSEKNRITRDNISFDREFDVYDFGAALVAGVNLGIVKPYAGAGLGSERFKFENFESRYFDTGIEDNSFSESNYYWNGFGGAELTLLPFLKPFIEFRFSKLFDTDELDFERVSRLSVGINLRF